MRITAISLGPSLLVCIKKGLIKTRSSILKLGMHVLIVILLQIVAHFCAPLTNCITIDNYSNSEKINLTPIYGLIEFEPVKTKPTNYQPIKRRL